MIAGFSLPPPTDQASPASNGVTVVAGAGAGALGGLVHCGGGAVRAGSWRGGVAAPDQPISLSVSSPISRPNASRSATRTMVCATLSQSQPMSSPIRVVLGA